MPENLLSVREIEEKDIDFLANYWANADAAFLLSMGADINKLPEREELKKMLAEQLSLPYEEKKSYCIIWLADDKAIGHSNVNKIIYAEEAYMHLHLWNADVRKKGFGVALVKMTIPYFFKNLKLKKLFCEPYALNPAPNKTLEKAGFTFVKNYVTTPGWINFEQKVNLWEIKR
jgi:RimJ/RimL family protein N-acetyltransferase